MKRLLSNSSAAALIFGAGIALSLLVWWLIGLAILREERKTFETTAQVSAGLIERRFERYVDLLHGVQGLFGHYRGVSRLEFHQYVEALDLPRRFPGLQSLQYIQRVRRLKRTSSRPSSAQTATSAPTATRPSASSPRARAPSIG